MLKKNSININKEHLPSWCAVTGFYLPRTEGELSFFNKLYSDYEFELTGEELSFADVWDSEKNVQNKLLTAKVIEYDFSKFRMAARGIKNLSPDIRTKLRQNQSNAKSES